jgi:hypothetical protein
MSNCCKSNCSTNTNSSRKSTLGFLVAMFFVVLLGGTAYMYFDATVFSPVDAQEQTAMNNPGVGHPPKGKRASSGGNANNSNAPAPAKPRTDANPDEN